MNGYLLIGFIPLTYYSGVLTSFLTYDHVPIDFFPWAFTTSIF